MAIINGTNGNDKALIGTSFADTINGLNGLDNLFGGIGNDELFGGDGNDNLFGGIGADRLFGGTGNDFLKTIDTDLGASGGEGTDTISIDFRNSSSALSAALQVIGLTRSGTWNGASISSVELIDATLFGSSLSDTISITDSYFSNGINFDLGAGNDSASGTALADTMLGGSGNDTLTGFSGDDRLFGGIGLDRLSGDIGNDFIETVDVDLGVSGGVGTDTISFNFSNSAVGLFADLDSIGTAGFGLFNGASITGIERILQTIFGSEIGDDNIQITDSYGANNFFIDLGGGNDAVSAGALGDVVFGAEGDDNLVGNLGDDSLNGGEGDDDLFGGSGADTLTGGIGADSMFGGAGNDLLLSGAGLDFLSGNDGDDILEVNDTDTAVLGGADSDTIRFDFRASTVGLIANLAGIGNGLTGNYNGATITDVELIARDLFGSDTGNDTITITDSNFRNTFHIRTGGGNDVVIAGRLDDLVEGGADNDNLRGGLGFDALLGGTGDDTLRGEGDDDRLEGEDGRDVLDGGNGNDEITGGEGNDTLTGGGGNDTMFGGLGLDRYNGGAGNDFMELVDVDAQIAGGAGTDTIQIDFSDTLALNANLSQIGVNGTGTINGVAVSGIERIGSGLFGNDGGNDVIIVGDTYIQGALNIYGFRGNDQISGGGLGDILRGGEGDDILDGNNGGDILEGNEGTDILRGGAGGDILNGGDGADQLEGGADNSVDILDGGAGADTMSGGLGDDFYAVDSFADVIVESNLADSGIDQISTELDGLALSAYVNVENLQLNGTANLTASGNGKANEMIGNSGNNTLSGLGNADSLEGRSGDDILLGGLGTDSLKGGFGVDQLQGGDLLADRFVWGLIDESGLGAGSRDQVLDFDAADLLDLSGIDANLSVANDQAFVLIASGAAFAVQAQGQVRAAVIGGNTIIAVENTGDGLVDMEIQLTGFTIAMTVADFIL